MPMDICSDTGLSVTDHVNDLHALDFTHGSLEVFSVDELSNQVTKFLSIQDDKEEDSSSSLASKNFNGASENGLHKCATFPCSGKRVLSSPDAVISEASIDGDGENVKSLDPSSFRSISLPTHLKPVSAMKGSREKQGGAPPVKLTVKWAPGVYDPIPSSVSHVVTNNRSCSKHSRKSSKNKQKKVSKSSSSSSRGSKNKEKKQVRKHNSSSMMGYYNKHQHDEAQDFGEVDFHIVNADQYCATSFLKICPTTLHLSSVAEAT